MGTSRYWTSAVVLMKKTAAHELLQDILDLARKLESAVK
jgi:hypothetical protein